MSHDRNRDIERLQSDFTTSFWAIIEQSNFEIKENDFMLLMNKTFKDVLNKATYNGEYPKRTIADVGDIRMDCPTCKGKGFIPQGR